MFTKTSRYKLLEPAILIAGLSISIIAIIILAGKDIMLVLLAFSAGSIAFSFCFRQPFYFVLGYFLVLPLYLENPEGVTTGQAIFLAYTILLAFFFLYLPIISGRLKLETTLDKLFLLFTLMLPFASVLGLLNGASAYAAFGEITYYAGVFVYFAFRYYMDNALFQKSLIFLIFLILSYVLARNAYYYQEIIMQAYLPWQVEKARVASNEVLILFFSTLCTVAFVYLNDFKYKIAALLFLGIAVASLVLTQSRGYWLAYAIAFFLTFLLVKRRKKIQMALYFSAILILVIGIAKIYFSTYFDLIITALILRFESIATSTQADISVLERIDESTTVLSKIFMNPIAGYGLGTEYIKFIYFERIHISTSYIHNGYLAAWFKFGLFGLLLILGICISIFRSAYKIFRENNKIVHKILSLTIIATLAGMMFVNNTSPQFLAFDSFLLLTIMAVYCSQFLPDKVTGED